MALGFACVFSVLSATCFALMFDSPSKEATQACAIAMMASLAVAGILFALDRIGDKLETVAKAIREKKG